MKFFINKFLSNLAKSLPGPKRVGRRLMVIGLFCNLPKIATCGSAEPETVDDHYR